MIGSLRLKIASVIFVIAPAILLAQTSSSLMNRLIVLDAGHGVIGYKGEIVNFGQKTEDGIPEHRLAFAIAQRIGEHLKREGANVVFTRTPFDYWRTAYNLTEDNKSRALFANELKAGVLLSIHCDWDFRKEINGVTTLYETPQSKKLGEIIHLNLIKELKAKDRNLVRENFTLLDHAEMPALIIETGFMSNRMECRKLGSPSYQTKIAQAVVEGLKAYFKN